MKNKLLTLLLGLLTGASASTVVAATNTVVIGNYFFNPTNLTINLGDTVRWTNSVWPNVIHDSTRASMPFNWASPDLDGSPTTFLLTFTNAGTFPYYCERHVIIQANHLEQTGRVFVVSIGLPPSVSITNPPNNTLFAPPANVTIQATAADSDGSVTNVQFLVGTALVGNDTTAPYAATTNGLPAGNFTLFAIASDNSGLRATNSVNIVVSAPPSVSITNPPNNTIFAAPANVTIQATASDDGTVTNVQFLVGTAVVGNDTTAPYAATTNGLPVGNFTLFAIASDNSGLRATNSINIVVSAPNAPPSVSITNPPNNTLFAAPANVIIQATASDDGSVTNVQFLVGTAVVGNDTTAPYAATTNGLPAGSFTLFAIASDNTGTRATNSVNILVSAPPLVSLTNPPNDAKLIAPANIQLQASASDEGSVTNVQFFSGGALLGSDTAAPYSFTLNNAVAGNYSFTARAQDNTGLASTSAVVNVSVLTNAILTSPNVLPNGQFWMTVQGVAGQTYATETSTNLANWLAISTNVAPANIFNVTDTTSTNVLQRFYRTRQN